MKGNFIYKTLRQLTANIYDFMVPDAEPYSPSTEQVVVETPKEEVKAPEEKSNKAVCTTRIEVGKAVTPQARVKWDDGEMYIDLKSEYFDYIFRKEMERFTKSPIEKYDYGNLYKDANEVTCYKKAISAMALNKGYVIEFEDAKK